MAALAKKTRHEIRELPRSDRSKYLAAALMNSQNQFVHVLFLFLVKEYQAGATKSKMMLIWDKCLKGNLVTAVSFGEVNTLNMEVEVDREPVVSIKGMIETYERMRQQARQMNRLKRFFTSSDRVPPFNIFDDLVTTALKKTGDNVWKDIETRLHTTEAWLTSDWKQAATRLLPAAVTEIREAGFDMGLLGLNEAKRLAGI